MEILKGFVFDIQRFANATLKKGNDTTTLDIATADKDITYVAGTGFALAGSGTGATAGTIGTTNNAGVITWGTVPEGVILQFDADAGKPVPSHANITFTDGTNSFIASAGATIEWLSGTAVDKGFKVTGNPNITVVAGTPVFGDEIGTGTVSLVADGTNASGVKLNYQNDNTQDTPKIVTSIGQITYTTNADTNNVVAEITKAGVVSGMANGEKAEVTDDATIAGRLTVTANAGSGSVTFAKDATTKEVSITALGGTSTVETTRVRTVLGDTLKGTATASATSITALTVAGTEFTTTSTKNITASGGLASAVKVNGWDVKAGIANATVTTKPSATGGIQKVTQTAGTGTDTVAITATLTENSELTAGDKEYVLAKGGTNNATFTFDTSGNSTVTTGNFYISSTATAKSLTGSGATSNSVTVNGDAYVKMATGQFSSVTDLGSGESISVDTTAPAANVFTLTANSTGVVTYTAGGVNTYFQIADGQTTTTMTSAVWDTTSIANGIIKDASGNTVLQKAAGTNSDIDVAKCTQTTWFLADGTSFTKEPSEAYAAKVEVSGSGDSATRTLTITKDLNTATTKVVIDRVATTVKDTSTKDNTVYKVTNKGGVAWIKGAEFAVSAEGVISDSTGTITLTDGGAGKQLFLSGSVSVDASAVTPALATDPVLTYVAGNGLTDTKVTLSTASPIVINESTNDTDTVIIKSGTITGLDAGASVKNAFNGSSITTAGSDSSSNTYTINGVEWTVTGDEKTTFTVNDTMSTQLSAIGSLDLDATVTTTKKFEQATLSVNGTTFKDVVSKDGLTFTSTTKDTAASVELNAAGESATLTIATVDYKFTVSSTSDGVTIGADGKVSGLTNGDTVTIHTGTDATKNVMTLTVSDNKLTVNGVDSTGAELPSTTYTLDSGESEFTAKLSGYATTTSADVKIENGTAGEALAAGAFQLATGAGATLENITSVSNGVYVDKNGAIMNDNASNKAVGQIQMTDDKITYAEIGDKTQTLNVTDTKHEWDITTNGGKDTITYTGTQAATINSGAGDDFITASSNNDLYITLGAGKDTVNIGGMGDHTIVAGEGNSEINVTATGDVRVDATGAGNKKINHTGAGVATLYGGDGNDTIKAAGLDDSVVGGAGNNVFNVATTGAKVSDYDVSKDVVFVAGTSASTLAAGQFISDGTVSLSATAGHTLDVSAGTGTDSFYAVNAKGTDNKTQYYAWTKESGSNIDLSTIEKSVVMIGNNNDDKGDTLVGGQKNDIIYAGSGDSVYGGAGKDSIILDSTAGGEVVFTGTAAGKDTVTGFKSGFEDGDSINFVDGNAADVKFSFKSGTATVKDGDGSLEITSLKAATSGAVELYAAGTKVAVAEEKKTIKTDSSKYADVYVGKDSIVDFSGSDEALNVNLANGIGGDTNIARFSGITAAKGGTGATTLMGASGAESLVAGSGKTSLYGGAGADTLVGGAEADMFFMGANEGTNTMVGFTGGTDETSDTLYFLSDITGAKLGSSGVEITADNSKAVLSGTNANTAIHFSVNGTEGVAKVGSTSANNSFGYDKTVTYYGGGSKTDKITLASGDTTDAQIWLDGSQGVTYASIDIIDASNGSGNLILAGDSSSQTITGGKGGSSLWGGVGSSADSLKGGSGTNAFFYGFGEGNDTIVSSNADDSVNLYNIKLSDVKSGEITNAGVSVELNDGSKLTVSTSKDITFKLADGSSYVADHASKTWK